MNDKLDKILDLVKEYIDEKNENKEWVAGRDFVNYAGPYFNSDEYVSAAETLLDGWLVMGDKSIKFEKGLIQFINPFSKGYFIISL